jgi:DNA-directed RNA polymerase specialized sigma subunit
MTLKEIGKVLGVSESRVSQVLSQAMQSLKKRVKNKVSDLGSLSEILQD